MGQAMFPALSCEVSASSPSALGHLKCGQCDSGVGFPFSRFKFKEPHVASGFCMVSAGLRGSKATIFLELESALQMAPSSLARGVLRV